MLDDMALGNRATRAVSQCKLKRGRDERYTDIREEMKQIVCYLLGQEDNCKGLLGEQGSREVTGNELRRILIC